MIELNRILCPVDFSPFSDRALRYAMKLSLWYGATLQVLHVMPPLPPSSANALAATSRQLTARNLRAAVDRYTLPGVDVAAEIVESADPIGRILERADAFDVDLIVTGSHGRTGVQRVLLGSVVEGLLHRSGRPVLTVPSHLDPALAAHITFSRIVCAIDFSAPSLAALAYALSLAEEADARLILLHVIDPPPELAASLSHEADVNRLRAESEANALTRLRALVPEHARDYCAVETAVLEGGAAQQVLRMAKERHADLIVLGVHGRNAFDLAFFGSTSKDVIRQAYCPVMVVPAGRRAALRAAS